MTADISPPDRLTDEEIGAAVQLYTPMLANWSIKAHRRNREMPYEDAMQAAVMGFIYGMKRFDKSRGVRICSYAGWWAKVYISREAHTYASRGMAKRSHNSEIVPVRVAALDAPARGDSRKSMTALVAAREDEEKPEFSAKFWHRVAEQLDRREFWIVHARFVVGMSYKQIATTLGLTRSRVQQLAKLALRKLEGQCDFGSDRDGGY